MFAAHNGHLGSVEVLVDAGADLQIEDQVCEDCTVYSQSV